MRRSARRRDPGPPPSERDSLDVVARHNALLARLGYCFWAVEQRETARFVGWCGIKPGKPPIEDETEIAWTIAPDLWGRGLAREAAEAVLAWAWTNTDRRAIAAITTPGNRRSWGLMERIGMTRVAGGDFDHPDLPDESPLKRHIRYAVSRPG